MSSLPSDEQLIEQVKVILNEAHDKNTITDMSRRKVREILSDHFGVNLEAHKKKVSALVEEQNQLISDARKKGGAGRAQASTSAASSPVKSALAKAPAKSSKEKKAPAKRNRVSWGGDDDDDDDDNDHKDPATAITISSDVSDAAASEDFSELEKDTSVSRSRGKKSKSAPAKKISSSSSSSSSSSAKRKSTSTATAGSSGGSEAEQRLTRLKKLVLECGVRKQWKKLYTAAGVSDTDFNGQCKVVQDVLRELGMTGKGSIEQARKIREEREFADELAGLQENEVIETGTRGRRTRGSLGGGGGAKKSGSRAKAVEISDDDTADDDEDESDFEASAKKSRGKRAVSDSEGSEDDGPTRRKSFKSSLASFAADSNSDSD